MRNNLIALFLSLSIHALILAALFLRFSSDLFIPPPMGSENGQKVSLKNINFASLANNAQNTPQIQQTQPPQPKKEIKKQEQKKDTKKEQNIKKDSAKVAQKPQKAQTKPQTPPPTPPNAQKSEQIMHTPSIYDYSENLDNKEIVELYGNEFGSLSRTQRDFIKSNLDSIGKITQGYLKYPLVAGKIGQEGQNIVEFYLHPNGDITELKLLTSSGFTLLDDNSLHTIKIAYKDYPYPNEKTKIRIRVTYRIY